MTFSDPDTLRQRLSRTKERRFATIEIGHEDFKKGLLVKVDFLSSVQRLAPLALSIIEAGAAYPSSVRRIADPGWWAGVACEAANRAGLPASVVRGSGLRSLNHMCMVVAHGGLLDEFPAFPRFRMGLGPALQDMRGELARGIGPTDTDLNIYAALEGIEASPSTLRRMFDIGVLVWGADDAGGPRVVAAGRDF